MQKSDARTTGHMTSARRIKRAASIIALAVAITTFCSTQTAAAARIPESPPSDVLSAIILAFPVEVLPQAIAVAKCESRWVINDRTSGIRRSNVGLFQINRVHRARLEALGYSWDSVRLDPYVNAVVAARLWSDQGWRPWSCKKVLPRSLRNVRPNLATMTLPMSMTVRIAPPAPVTADSELVP